MAADHLRICGFLHLGLWRCPAALRSFVGKCHYAPCGAAPGGNRVPLPQGPMSGRAIQVLCTTFTSASTAAGSTLVFWVLQLQAKER